MRWSECRSAGWIWLALCLALSGCAGAGRGTRTGEAILKTASGAIGSPYRMGGTSPKEGFDCSGLAWWSHRAHGIDIPRSSFEQFKHGRTVTRGALAPGDLVFFHTVKAGASHVGIYAGGGAFIHSPKTGRPVERTSLELRYWKERYLGARRYY